MGSDSDSTDEFTSAAPNDDPTDVQLLERRHTRLSTIYKVAQDILHNICKNDDRFLFIKAAIEEFLHGSNGMDDKLSMTSNIIAYNSNPGDLSTATKILTQYIRSTQGEPRSEYNEIIAIRDVALSTIFEIISVFGITVTTEQVQLGLQIGPETSSFVQLLDQLHTISKDLLPQSVQQSVSEHNIEDNITANKSHVFNYHMKIDQKVSQVQVIKLLPGSENDPIKCHLTLCNVLGGGIEEALSYV
ncbi:hypothetical protein F4679DRAFT_569063 [Xylaria curta]|nr:hypothetical protein F4679DRAFT_569063 [Xylaria curta]